MDISPLSPAPSALQPVTFRPATGSGITPILSPPGATTGTTPGTTADAANDADAQESSPDGGQNSIEELQRRERLEYLQLYLDTLGAPEEKLDQQEAAEEAEQESEEDEEEERKKMLRGAKDALIVHDPEQPEKTQIMVRSYDRKGRPHFTRTHTVDMGGGTGDRDRADNADPARGKDGEKATVSTDISAII